METPFRFKNKRNHNNVGFVIAGDRLEKRHVDLIKYVEQIRIFIDWLKFNGYRVILINHLYDTWINEHINFDGFIDLYGKTSSEIYATYSEIDTVVSDRGHGQMIPFSCGCKIISPISHDKLKWFLDDMDLEEFGVEEYDEELGRKLIYIFMFQQTLDWNRVYNERMGKIKSRNSINTRKIMDLIK